MANIGTPARVGNGRGGGSGSNARARGPAVEILRAEDIAPALGALKGRAEALYVCADPLAVTNRDRINTLALGARLPTMYNREYVEAGGLMSYGPNYLDLNRRAGDYVDKILRGAKPSDLPVEQPTKFDLTLNLITAQGARPGHPADPSRPRRRGDRVRRVGETEACAGIVGRELTYGNKGEEHMKAKFSLGLAAVAGAGMTAATFGDTACPSKAASVLNAVGNRDR